MHRPPLRRRLTLATLPLLAGALIAAFHYPPSPESALVAVVKAYLALGAPPGWDALDKLPGVRWAPLPATALQNCLPDGGCFARQGSAAVAGRTIAVVATGARSMATHLYLRNAGMPFGEAAVVAALKEASLAPTLARCPVTTGRGGTNWYRLATPGYISVQAATSVRPTEGFVVGHGDELPRLQPDQLVLYSEQCGDGAERKAVSTAKPHELLAQSVVALLAPAGPAGYSWMTLPTLLPGIAWNGRAPKPVDGALSLSGMVKLAGREFSVVASGSASEVKAITFDELGLHPRGEHMLGVVYQKGIAVQLVRCGPVYTESTNNWYSLVSPRTRPANIRQSIRYDGNQVQDAYVLRLDGTLPARDPRDRNPGSAGC
ncbi:MAG: hypothetical protein ABIZ70_01175 [Gemmatimonadales bacterium]